MEVVFSGSVKWKLRFVSNSDNLQRKEIPIPIRSNYKNKIKLIITIFILFEFSPSVESGSEVSSDIKWFQLLPIALVGVELWSSLPSSASIATKPTNNWLIIATYRN
jgi:hypothetical protein